MATNIEMRVFRLEQMLRVATQQISDLQQQLGQVAQDQVAQAASGGGSGGSGSGSYVAYSSSAIAAGASASLTVYSCQAGSTTSLGTQTVYNYGNSATVAGNGTSTFTLYLVPDGAGNYTIYNQTCA